ncbi:MAG: DNA-binding protein [Bacteroides sp.]|jgi:hypothetical protein|nr:DNA-binding protein [Bacteroides sp.]
MKRNTGKVQPVQKVWLCKDEAMAFMGCSADYLRKLRVNALVSFAQEGNMIWYDVRSLERFIVRNKMI